VADYYPELYQIKLDSHNKTFFVFLVTVGRKPTGMMPFLSPNQQHSSI